MEGYVQTPTADHGNAVPTAQHSSTDSSGAAGLIPDEGTRQREQLNVLLAGFATGMCIAGIFLIYILMEAGKLLP